VKVLVDLLAASTVIISGGAEGIDKAAVAAGLGSYRPVVALNPMGADRQLWVTAAFARNGFIALCSDVVVAFWTGESKGTADTIRKALKLGKCIVALPGQPAQVWVSVVS
jgi:predicted Rossmann fold nucleotide-binding protein DprA/Smf involved in DNA uptake